VCTASISSGETLERWGCIDSTTGKDIYYLDIHEDHVVFDYRDERLKPNRYEILQAGEHGQGGYI